MIRATIEGRLRGEAMSRTTVAFGGLVERELVAGQLDGRHPHIWLMTNDAACRLASLPEGARVRVEGDLILDCWRCPDGSVKPRGRLRIRSLRALGEPRRPKPTPARDTQPRPATAPTEPSIDGAHAGQHGGAHAHSVAPGRGSVEVSGLHGHDTVPTISVQQKEHSL